jgi:hypothetical protein
MKPRILLGVREMGNGDELGRRLLFVEGAPIHY